MRSFTLAGSGLSRWRTLALWDVAHVLQARIVFSSWVYADYGSRFPNGVIGELIKVRFAFTPPGLNFLHVIIFRKCRVKHAAAIWGFACTEYRKPRWG